MRGGAQGEQLLVWLEAACKLFPACNVAACLKAQQEVKLGHLEQALTTTSSFLGLDGSAPSCWALQIKARIAWLQGDVALVCPVCPFFKSVFCPQYVCLIRQLSLQHTPVC